MEDVSASTTKKITWDNLIADSSITTAKLANDSVTDAKLVLGKVSNRQAGASAAGSWRSTVGGPTNTAVDSTNVRIQCGTTVTDATSDTTVTFPVAFAFEPVLVCSVVGNINGTGAVTANCFAEAVNVTTTTAIFRTFNTGGGQSNQAVSWIAIGQ